MNMVLVYSRPAAEPIRLPIEGTTDSVHRPTFDDSRAIIAKLVSAACSHEEFIGLEVAASNANTGNRRRCCCSRTTTTEKVLGPEMGRFVRKVHEDHGVAFHLGETISRIDGGRVRTSGGTLIDADVVVIGAGVRPALDLADVTN